MRKSIFIILTICCPLFWGCSGTEKYFPELSFYNDNALLPTISFQTNDESEIFIEYWPQDNTKRIQRSKNSSGKNHSLTLFNVKPTSKYYYQIINVKTEKKSEAFSFMTNVLPDEMLALKKVLIDTNQFNGFILVRKISSSSADVLIDNEGDIVWYQRYDTIVRRPFIWTAHNTILSSYDTAEIVEYDIYGNTILNINLERMGVPNSIHHEVIFNAKNEIVALTLDSARKDLRKIGGGKDQYIRADGILRLSSTGEKLWEWNLLDVYDPVKNFTGKFDPKQSLGHANSLTIDKDGHYLVSFRDFGQVWKINSDNGSVIWKFGKDGDFQMDKEYYFIAQHSLYFNESGELGMFDNGDKVIRPNSRVLSFKLDEQRMEAKIGAHVVLPEELSAYKMCSAVVIAEGKYLVCTSRKNGIIAIVNENAETLWRVDLSHPSYRAYYLSDPFEGTH